MTVDEVRCGKPSEGGFPGMDARRGAPSGELIILLKLATLGTAPAFRAFAKVRGRYERAGGCRAQFRQSLFIKIHWEISKADDQKQATQNNSPIKQKSGSCPSRLTRSKERTNVPARYFFRAGVSRRGL